MTLTALFKEAEELKTYILQHYRDSTIRAN